VYEKEGRKIEAKEIFRKAKKISPKGAF